MILKKQAKVFFQSMLTVLISVLIIFTAVKAGNITPPSGTPSAKFYTISEIYNFIANNTAATEGGHSFTFSDNLEGTGRTLTDIYYALSHLISADKVKLGTTYLNVAGALVPSGGDATTADVCLIKKYFGANQTDWNLATGALTIDAAKMLDTAAYCGITGTIANCGSEGSQSCYAAGTYYAGTSKTVSNSTASQSAGYYPAFNLATVDTDLITGNIKSGIALFGVNGDSNVVNTSSGDAIAGDILINKKAWVAGSEITGSAVAGANVSGSNSSLSFTIPDGSYSGSKTCTASDTNLAALNIKKSTSVFGITGSYSGYPGTVWTGTPVITQALCDAQNGSGWYWFEDGNGDGDTTDAEDGICVKTTAGTAGSWNGDFYATARDNSYIAAYTCSGSFPSGTVATYSGINAAGAADNTFNNGDCALCQADCYDGQKDLPDQGGYTTPSEAITGNGGPITPEVLKNWKGTRLPTSNDFFGFCGATSGDIDSTVGDSAYHSSGASSSKTIGNYGGNIGRGANSVPNDEYVDLSNSGNWEWLSEQPLHLSCEASGPSRLFLLAPFVLTSYRFRAVFRP